MAVPGAALPARLAGCRRRRRQRLPPDPGIEEPPLRCFPIVAHDHAEIAETPAAEREAAQRAGLDPNQQRQQQAGDGRDRIRRADESEREMQRNHDDDVADQDKPHAMAQHPERTENQRPERKPVAHEHEAVRIGRAFVFVQRRLVHGVDGHGRSTHGLAAARLLAGAARVRHRPGVRPYQAAKTLAYHAIGSFGSPWLGTARKNPRLS